VTDLTYATVGELNAALAARSVSASDLTEAAIARIEKVDGKLNAVVVRDFERARVAAKAADVALARGETKPLLGIPMTVKEANNVAGLKTTWGSPGFADYVASEDGAAIARLKNAGAIILGKTNVPVFLSDWQSNNPIYGRTNNPWDVTKTPGGSSGGGAAAVASGMVPLEFGSDFGGSIRVPAAFCGIYGHKPSFGIVPMRGMKPPSAPDGNGIPISVLGPLARSAEDLELALDVLAGPDEMEGVGYRLVLPKARHERLHDFRVLVIDAHPVAALDDEIKAALHAAAEKLQKLGAHVSYKSDLLPDMMEMLQCFRTMVGVATSRGMPPEEKPMTAHQWMDVQDQQLAIRRRWAAFFQTFDVVLAPAFGTAAFAHLTGGFEATITVNGKPSPYGVQGGWSSMAGVANLPSTAAPIGKTKSGLPIGMQIIGPYLEDRTTIQFARLLANEIGGFTPPPI
jgi:amidase